MQSLILQNPFGTRALAVSAAMLASYAALSLAERLEKAHGFWGRRLWISCAAVVLGLGMWSMHFLGTLDDARVQDRIYAMSMVTLCLLVGVSVSWIVFRLVAWQALSRLRMGAGALVLSAGVLLLNLVATHALRSAAVAGWSVGWILTALLIGSVLSWVAFWMSFGEHYDPAIGEWMRVAGGALLGSALAMTDFLGSGAVHLRPLPVGFSAGGSNAHGWAVGEMALIITVGLILLVTLGTAAVDKGRYRELARLNAQLAASQQALLRSEGQLREANAMLSELSIRDSLTGLYNRRRFDHVLEMEWRRGMRTMRPLGLLMIDVDCFKALNDSYGHQRGDQCLREIARVLDSQPRRSHDTVARFGGEEFVVLLPGADVPGALRVAESIRRAVEAQEMEHRNSLTGAFVTVSIGVSSMIPQVGEAAPLLLQKADMALYLAKEQGRNRVEVHETEPTHM